MSAQWGDIADEQLFVSILTSTIGYFRTTLVLLSVALITLITEFIWIEVVYRKFPVLGISRSTIGSASSAVRESAPGFIGWIKREKQDWTEFSRLPIFFSQSRLQTVFRLVWTDSQGSIAIAAIYLTTLSYGEITLLSKSAEEADR
jgi:iron-regulated transporter 1